MCGLCGFIYREADRPVERDRLSRMLLQIEHRGPDGEGDYLGGVALGHRRLSIVDPEGGQQPLSNEDGSVWVTFDGVIYNYRELRERLKRRGHRFRTRSDSEVLVHAYEEHGTAMLPHLNGMFAFALYDRARRQVVLARDPLGVKPLFYTVTDEGLFFASEIKAVLAGTGRAPALRREGVAEYLAFRHTVGRDTLFDGIHRLPPGHVAIWSDGQLRIQAFWRVPEKRPDRAIPLDEGANILDQRISRAIEMQCMGDVPLGAFCSGGVDSGLVVGHAARQRPDPLPTFSIGFEDPALDETALARDTARRFGTDHHVLVARPESFRDAISRLIWYHDEPLSHPNSVPMYFLSQRAREQVKVVLTGEGPDELFGGYGRYQIVRILKGVDHLPSWVARLLSLGLRPLTQRRTALFADQLSRPIADAMVLNAAYVHPATIQRLFGIAVEDVLTERRRLLESVFVPRDPIATITRYEMITYLTCSLDRTDRMAMASGLEARVPLLDIDLVEWGLRLHSSLKVHGRERKAVVKHLARRTLSPRITDGPKSGFSLPLRGWLRSSTFAGLLDRLRDPAHPAAELFDRGALARIVSSVLDDGRDQGELLWLLINFFLWHETWLEERLAPPVEGWAAPVWPTGPTAVRAGGV